MSIASSGSDNDPVRRPEARVTPAGSVYLDHAATTPMLPAALTAMTEELAQLGIIELKRTRKEGQKRESLQPEYNWDGFDIAV